MASKIRIKEEVLSFCNSLINIEKTETIKDLLKISVILPNINKYKYNYLNEVLNEMQKKYAIEIVELECLVSNLVDLNINIGNSNSNNYNQPNPYEEALKKVKFAIYYKIYKDKGKYRCKEDFLDMRYYIDYK